MGGCRAHGVRSAHREKALALAALAVSMPFVFGAPASATTASCAGGMVVASPVAGLSLTRFSAVAGVSGSDLWAVGYEGDALANGLAANTVAEHWDGTAWSLTTTVNPSKAYNDFNGVAAAASNDVWAVGSAYGEGKLAAALIEHWDGTSWSISPSPKISTTRSSFLNAVAVVSPDDVWAVGETVGDDGVADSLALHWDGSAWSTVTLPNPGIADDLLSSVVAVSSNEIWAVGRAGNRTLTEQWDGSAWTVVASPSPGSSTNYLRSVTVAGGNDVWAVGSRDGRTLAMEWNRGSSSWNVVSTPNIGKKANELDAVTPGASGELWAVGTRFTGARTRTIAEHYAGGSWSVVAGTPNPGRLYDAFTGGVFLGGRLVAVGEQYTGTSPLTLAARFDGTSWAVLKAINLGNGTSYLKGVGSFGSSSAWAVGYVENGDATQTLVEQWNGSRWSVIPSPNVKAVTSALESVSVLASNDVWAVGYSSDGNVDRPLAEHWNGNNWSIAPVPRSGLSDRLTAIAQDGSGGLWAAGYSWTGSEYQPLIEHWDAATGTWSLSSVNAPPNSQLAGVAADSSGAWAVGAAVSGGSSTAVILQWNGSVWNPVAGAALSGANSQLESVTVVGGTPWAVGTLDGTTLIERVGSSGWELVPSPSPGSVDSELVSVSGAAGNDIWAVGSQTSGDDFEALVEHWDGTSFTEVQAPTAPSEANNLYGVDGSGSTVWSVGAGYSPDKGLTVSFPACP